MSVRASLEAGTMDNMHNKTTDARDCSAMTSPRRQLTQSPLLDAAFGVQPAHRPVWFMRQAGRSLPEYRRVREKIGMLDACFTPDIAAEITLQPVRRHNVDAAIFFSDIIIPLKAAGIDIDIAAGRGPVVDMPIRSRREIDSLPELEPSALSSIGEAIRNIIDELRDDQALIGFAGAPFTMASYLIEGGPSKTHQKTKAMIYADPESWHALMRILTEYVKVFLGVQIDAGIDAMQLFDSWAGYLRARDYEEFVAPYSSEIFTFVRERSSHGGRHPIPRIHFGVTSGELLGSMAGTGPDVVGVDWRVDMTIAAERVTTAVIAKDTARQCKPLALQGNLDPALLFAGDKAVDREIDRLLTTTDQLISGGKISGHIVNLGHGVLPDTDPEIISHIVEKVHSW